MANNFIKTYGDWIFKGLSLFFFVAILYLNSNYVSKTDYKVEQASIRTDLVSQQASVKQDLTSQQVAIKADVTSQQVILSSSLNDFRTKTSKDLEEINKTLSGIQVTLAIMNENTKSIVDHENRLRILEKTGK